MNYHLEATEPGVLQKDLSRPKRVLQVSRNVLEGSVRLWNPDPVSQRTDTIERMLSVFLLPDFERLQLLDERHDVVPRTPERRVAIFHAAMKLDLVEIPPNSTQNLII